MKSKAQLQSEIKSAGVAYLLYFLLFGTHYAYQGKWGLQFLFWITLGGFGLWALIDLFRIPSMISSYNTKIFSQIEAIEKKEKEEMRSHEMALIAASK